MKTLLLKRVCNHWLQISGYCMPLFSSQYTVLYYFFQSKLRFVSFQCYFLWSLQFLGLCMLLNIYRKNPYMFSLIWILWQQSPLTWRLWRLNVKNQFTFKYCNLSQSILKYTSPLIHFLSTYCALLMPSKERTQSTQKQKLNFGSPCPYFVPK